MRIVPAQKLDPASLPDVAQLLSDKDAKTVRGFNTGRAATLSVAASNASARSKQQADYVCDGVKDEEEINTALGALPSVNGKVSLSEGDFNLYAAVTGLNGKTDCVLEGVGLATNLKAAVNISGRLLQVGTSGSVATRCWARNLKITGLQASGNGDGLGFGNGGDFAVDCGAENVYVTNCRAVGVGVWADKTKILNCSSYLNGVDLYTSSADDVLILGGYYKDTTDTDTGEVAYINQGARVKLIGAYLEQSVTGGSSPEILDWRSTDGLMAYNTFMMSRTTQTNAVITNATYPSGQFIGNTVISTSSTTTVGVGIQILGADWTLMGNFYKWGANQACIYLADSAANVKIIGDIALSGAWFVRAYRIASGLQLIGCEARTSSITDAVRIDADATTNFSGLYARGNRFTGLAGYAYRWVEGGGFTIDDVDIDDADISGNTGGTFIGTISGTNVRRRATKGFKTSNIITGTINSGATSAVVAHGLDGTPTVVNLNFKEQGTNDYGRVWWTADATNVTVNVSADPGASNLDFSAEVKLY